MTYIYTFYHLASEQEHELNNIPIITYYQYRDMCLRE